MFFMLSVYMLKFLLGVDESCNSLFLVLETNLEYLLTDERGPRT